MADTTPPSTTHRLDYRPPAFLVDSADLSFDLDPAATVVRACLVLRRNPQAEDRHAPLRLDGQGLTLLGIKVDGVPLPDTHYTIGEDGSLTIPRPSDILMLETEVRIAPERNTEFSGLYTSGGNFFTQCEAEGFRRITFFPDRPDVMTRFTVTITADKARYPVLLSNGNPAGTGEGENGRHWARWEDPHPKPSYLFALVAGDLVAVSDYFTTKSGRDVVLNIWVRSGDEDRCAYAMDSLKRSMNVGRGGLRPRIRPRRVQHRRRVRLQHGRDGEQGPQRLQHQIRPGQAGDGDRRRLPGRRDRHRPRVLPQLDRQPRHLPRLVPALPQGRADRLPRPAVQRRPGQPRREAHPRRARPPRRRSSRRMPARCRTPSAPTATSRSTISTRRPSTRRAPRWCACSTPASAPRPSAAAWTSTSSATTTAPPPSRISARRCRTPPAWTSRPSPSGTSRPAPPR